MSDYNLPLPDDIDLSRLPDPNHLLRAENERLKAQLRLAVKRMTGILSNLDEDDAEQHYTANDLRSALEAIGPLP